MNWSNLKSYALHALIVFAAVFSSTMAAAGWTVSKAAVVAAASAAGTSVLHYLTGLLPNAAATANRAAAREPGGG